MGYVIKTKKAYAIRFDMLVNGKRKQKQIGGFSSPKEAKDALIEVQSKINNNRYTLDNVSVGQIFEIWFRDYVDIQLAPKTKLYYHGLYSNYIKPSLEFINLRDIRANTIEKFYYSIERKGASKDIVYKCHKTLRACLNKAYKWDYIDTKIMDKVTSPKEPKASIDFWETDTIKRALELTVNSKVHYHICVSLYLGLRLGEVCAIEQSDINFNKRFLRVNKTLQYIKGKVIIKEPKTESSKREIPLSDTMIDVFKNRIKYTKENQLFMGQKYNHKYINYLSVFENGDIMTDSYVTKRFKKDIEKLDLPLIRFHDLRHSCASWLIANDVNLKIVQEILGHAEYSTTANIYAHASRENKKQALDKLSF